MIGTSTSGIASGEAAMVPKLQQNEWPETFDYRQQEMAAPALFIAQLAQVRGRQWQCRQRARLVREH